MPRSGFEKRKAAIGGKATVGTAKKKSYRKRASDAPTFDSVSPQLLHAIVCLCTTVSASPTFSYTRDGTSLVVAVYYDNERYVDYLSGEADLKEWFAWLVEELLEIEDIDLEPYKFLLSEKA